MKNKKSPVTPGNSKSNHLYSNSPISQRKRILKALEDGKKVTTFYCRDILGIPHPSGRVKDLRKLHNINTDLVSEPDLNGVEHHRIAHYIYLGLKKPGENK